MIIKMKKWLLALALLLLLAALAQAVNFYFYQDRSLHECRTDGGQVMTVQYTPEFFSRHSGCDYKVMTLGNPIPRSQGHYSAAHCALIYQNYGGSARCTQK
jgi:hypothetical protein